MAQSTMFATAADAQHQLGRHLMARLPCGSPGCHGACLAGRICELCAHGSTSGVANRVLRPTCCVRLATTR